MQRPCGRKGTWYFESPEKGACGCWSSRIRSYSVLKVKNFGLELKGQLHPWWVFGREVTDSDLGFAKMFLAVGGRNWTKRCRDDYLWLYNFPQVSPTIQALNPQTMAVMIWCLSWLYGPEHKTQKSQECLTRLGGDAGRLGSAGLKAGTNYSPRDKAGPIPAMLHY